MRAGILAIGGAGVLVVVALGAASACSQLAEDCTRVQECPSGGSSGTAGGGGNAACAGDPTSDASLVNDECGVFVSATAAPGGDGTKARPFTTLAEAAGTAPRRVYACAESYAETAGVSFTGGVEIYAGFTECGEAWTWTPSAKAMLHGPADAVSLTLSGGDNRVVNLDVVAASATIPGGSSIAVLASGGTVALVNGDLTAGDAMDGAAGAQHAMDVALDGDPGDPGVPVCMAGASNIGPAGKTKACETGATSEAGKGGDGGEIVMSVPAAAGNGGEGAPPDPAQPTKGVGGIGEGQGNPAAVSCDDGETGANGASGDSGAGASGIGSLGPGGYVGANGASGTNGKPGQGGGGGGASKGGLGIDCGGVVQNRVGASGGAGGTGGCGGRAGGGGQAGGSSVALVVLDTAVTLDGVALIASRAGSGGKGGDGQTGGQKGTGGGPGAGAGLANASCGGGDGGQGGRGGPGGGGQGGHSLGIAFQGELVPVGGEIITEPQNAGIGGPGGQSNTTTDAGKGADGLATDCWDFATNSICGG